MTNFSKESRVVRVALRQGPVFRLDPTRIVLRTRSGDIVLPWEDVTTPTKAERPGEFLMPSALLSGGSKGLPPCRPASPSPPRPSR